MNQYQKTTWTNNTGESIDEDNLNKIEQGIYDVTSEVITLSNEVTTVSSDLATLSNNVVKKINNVVPTDGNVKVIRTREFTISSTTAVTYTSPSGKTYTRRYNATGLTGVTANTIATVLSCTDNTVSNVVCETRANAMYIYFQVTPSTSAKVVVEFTESEAL